MFPLTMPNVSSLFRPPALLFITLLIVGLADGKAARPSTASAPVTWRNALIINEDNSHFYSSRATDKMTVQGLHEWVDQYAGTAVTHLFLCPNAMRTSFRSKSRDAIWEPVDGVKPTARWPVHAERLADAGLDPYAIWIARSREKNLSPWLTMRMNDVHSVNEPESYFHSSFWREHPEMRRVPNGSVTPWVNQALNYRHFEVRKHNLDLIDELLERYDPDGLELDWMRFGHHLTPGRERDEGHLLTEFMKEVKQKVDFASKRRGHPIHLAVRVPAHPDAASGLGMDAIDWAKAGLVDLIVPCPFWTTSDYDIPVELWLERLEDTARRVAVIPGLEYNSRAFPSSKSVANTLGSARGFAANAFARGATSIYLFNWMDSETRPVSEEDYHELLTVGLTAPALSGRLRRHPITYRDTVPVGFSNGVQLPVKTSAEAQLRIRVGSLRDVKTASLILGFSPTTPAASAQAPSIMINGKATTGKSEALSSVSDLGGVGSALRYPIPPSLLRDGDNLISLTPASTSAPDGEIVWAEFRLNES